MPTRTQIDYNTQVKNKPTIVGAGMEVPVGTINGTNLTFTVSTASSTLVGLWRNGSLLKGSGLFPSSYDYVYSTGTITFLEDSTPQSGDVLVAWISQ